MKITPELLADLKAKAQAATPGPWSYSGIESTQPGAYCNRVIFSEDGFVASKIFFLDNEKNRRCKHDAEYIVAASPDVVLAMASEIERLRAENKRLLVEAHDLDSSGGEMAKDCRQLEKEADWLAEQVAKNEDIPCPEHPCSRSGKDGCLQCWREAARKAVEER